MIDNNIYDCTNFKHPGGKQILQNNAGQDATTQFEDIGHTEKAFKLMEDLYIGQYKPNLDSNSPKEEFYPKQRYEPEYSLPVRIALAASTFLVMILLFLYLDSVQ